MKGLEWMNAGPPWWYRAGLAIVTGVTALCLASVVMLQWFLWLIVTGNLFGSPWGMGLGAVIWVAQIYLLFGNRPQPPESCPVPRPEQNP